MPYSLRAPVHSELIIKKSRFIGCVESVPDRAAALVRVAELRAEHPTATHVCWALMAGGHSAANDDGEPGGTAGRPMLEVLRHQELEGVLATVVRYYGGTPLGAGGLVRAYTDSVAQALLQAEKIPVIHHVTLCCELPYALEGWLRRELPAHGASLQEARHGDGVSVTIQLPASQAAAFIKRLNDAGQGRVVWPDPDRDSDSSDQT
ncbi:putative YigZ family protein [Hydrogenophaga palleronii]|uniref:YigZ family protein n=1 Tax=Hydrogenophaga palleronii TaxID=65655 RepID=A0ABU1WN71_9BURK|nr:YigZ family protein [Hydrogenophaga palleronii]MDR7150745.1 putative YigZ family protein [Hydrogenophaga palleronii]